MTFTAVPATGYEFISWKKRDRGFFGGDTSPSVRLYTSDFPVYPALLPFLETDEVFYLQPVFKVNSTGGSAAKTLYVAIAATSFTDDIKAVSAETGALVGSYKTGIISGIADLESVDGQIIVLASYSNSLYRFDFEAESLHKIGSTGITASPGDRLFTANGKLFLNHLLNGIYEINLSNGFATPLGIKPEGILASGNNGAIYSLSGNTLYTIDSNTWATIQEVQLSNPGSYQITDMALTSSGLIGVTNLGGTLVKIDPETRQMTGYAAVDDAALVRGMSSN